MHPLRLDFALPTPPDRFRSMVFIGLVALGAGVSIYHWLAHQEQVQLTQSISTEELHLRELNAIRSRIPQSTSDGISPRQLQSLLSALEASLDDSVTLLSFLPQSKEIELVIEAKDSQAAITFVKRLQTIPMLRSLHLTEAHTVREYSQHPVRLTVHASWMIEKP